MRVDRRDDRDPIWSGRSLSWRAGGAKIPGGRPQLKGLGGLHALESIPVQGTIVGLHHMPAEEEKESRTEGSVYDRRWCGKTGSRTSINHPPVTLF